MTHKHLTPVSFFLGVIISFYGIFLTHGNLLTPQPPTYAFTMPEPMSEADRARLREKGRQDAIKYGALPATSSVARPKSSPTALPKPLPIVEPETSSTTSFTSNTRFLYTLPIFFGGLELLLIILGFR